MSNAKKHDSGASEGAGSIAKFEEAAQWPVQNRMQAEIVYAAMPNKSVMKRA